MEANSNGESKTVEEQIREQHRSFGIHQQQHPKNGPSTSSGRYFFPRCYYEASLPGQPGTVGMGLPDDAKTSDFYEIDVVPALQLLFGHIFPQDEHGWFKVNHVKIHPND